jgi:hypothetical protein
VVLPDGVARTELFPELEQLQRDAAALADRLATAEAAAADASGRDPAEQVRVVLTPAGRVRSVEVRAGWRAEVAPSDLGSAVLAAYRDACDRRVETWAAEISRGKDHPSTDRAGTAQPMTSVAANSGPFDASAHESIRQLLYVLQDATDRLDELARESAARSAAVVFGRDSGGHVTATLTGGELTGLDLDERWSAEAGSREIGTAVTDAIASGYAAADRLAEDSLTARWPFPDLERLSGDPAKLLASLGLPGPVTQDHGSAEG